MVTNLAEEKSPIDLTSFDLNSRALAASTLYLKPYETVIVPSTDLDLKPGHEGKIVLNGKRYLASVYNISWKYNELRSIYLQPGKQLRGAED